MTGTDWETHLKRMLEEARTASGLYWLRHEPALRGRIRVSGGPADFGVVLNGTPHHIEAKLESGSTMDVGRLEGIDRECGSGVKPSQAKDMDAATKAGVRCWIAARLELPAATQRKLAQQKLVGAGGDVPACVQRLIPWDLWRMRMEAAEVARRDGGDVVASIPAAELAELGWPLRSAAELLAALQDELPW
jgi:hypothetical protein